MLTCQALPTARVVTVVYEESTGASLDASRDRTWQRDMRCQAEDEDMARKTALVTGAAAGIGRAIALRLAREGKAVGVLDLDLAGCEAVVAEIKAAGGEAIALQASIADRAQVTAAVETLRTALGPVTILVNNAGISNFIALRN